MRQQLDPILSAHLDYTFNSFWQETLWRTESDASVKPTASTSQADPHLEGSPESKDIQNEGATKASSSTLRSDGDRKTPTVGDVKSKMKKPLSRNIKLQNLDNKHEASKTREKRKEDTKESLEATERQGSGADEPEEGSSQPPSAQRRRRPGSPPARPKKRSRQLFSGGTYIDPAGKGFSFGVCRMVNMHKINISTVCWYINSIKELRIFSVKS